MKRENLILPESLKASPERQLIWKENMRLADEELQRNLDKWIREDVLRKTRVWEAARHIVLD